MAKLAITITVYAMVPADDYDEREGEIIDGIERGLQQAGADYTYPVVTRDIPAGIGDVIP